MEFNQMKQIMTIAKTGNISKAAEELYMSQSALSHALLKEEAQLEVKLFDRSSYPMKLTFAGQKYIEMAEGIQKLYRNFEKTCWDINQDRVGKIQIGIPYHRAAQIIAPVLREFKKNYPGIELEFVTENINILYDQMDKEKIDFCIQVHLENDLRFDYLPLFYEEMFFLAPEGMVQERHLESPGRISLESLGDFPLILHEEGSGSRKFLKQLSQTHQITLKPEMTIPNNQLILSLVGQGIGCTILSENVLHFGVLDSSTECFSITTGGIGWEVSAIRKKNLQGSKCELFLLELIQKHLQLYQKINLDIYPKFS